MRKWVVDAAASTPQGRAGEQLRLAIVQKGVSAVQDIVRRSTGELNSIGGKIRRLGDEYQAFLAGEGPLPSVTERVPEIVAVGVGALAVGVLGYIVAQRQWGKKFRWKDPSDEQPSEEAIQTAAAAAAARAR